MFKVLDTLCKELHFDKNSLPKPTLDVREDSPYVWCILYTCDDFFSLPFYWRMACGSVLYGLRFHRVGSYGKVRSEDVTSFCKDFLEWLWDKHTRKKCVMATHGTLCKTKITFQQCYDFYGLSGITLSLSDDAYYIRWIGVF